MLDSHARNRLNGVIALIAGLIAYGSFYPFDFVWHGVGLTEFVQFFTALDQRTTRADILGNIVLFLPYGFVAVFAAERRRSPGAHLLRLMLLGGLLAVLIQLVQIWLKSRIPAISDALWNALGLGLGAAGGWVMQGMLHHHRLFGNYSRLRFSLPVLLVALFVIGQWFPFMPVLSLQMVKDNAEPLLKLPVWGAEPFAHSFASWLVALYFYARTWPRLPLLLRPWFLVLGVLGVSLLVRGNPLTLSEASAAAAAALVLPLTMLGRRGLWLLSVLLLAHGFATLTPFELAEPLNRLNMIPFTGLLKGSIWINTRELLDKAFLYGAMLMLLVEVGASWRSSALLVTLWVAVMELLQITIAGRYPEVTEPLLVLFMAFGLSHAQAAVLHAGGHGAQPLPRPRRAARLSLCEERRFLDSRSAPVWRASPQQGGIGLLLGLGISLLAAWLLLTQFGETPWLAQPFGSAFAGYWLVVLALLSLSFGAGLGSLYLRARVWPWLALPLLALLIALPVHGLLHMGLSAAFHHQLLGALRWYPGAVAEGGSLAALLALLGEPLVSGAEYVSRSLLRIGSLSWLLLAMACLWRQTSAQALRFGILGGPALLLCGAGLLGSDMALLGAQSSAVVFALLWLGLLAMVSVALAHWEHSSPGAAAVALTATALSLPFGTWLLTRASGEELALARTSAVQLLLVLGLALGLRMALGLNRAPRTDF